MNFMHIIEGWYKSKIHADEGSKTLSKERLKVCIDCAHAVDKKYLKLINGDALEEKIKACNLCGCPIFEKSLAQQEKCDIGKWKR